MYHSADAGAFFSAYGSSLMSVWFSGTPSLLSAWIMWFMNCTALLLKESFTMIVSNSCPFAFTFVISVVTS